MNVVNRNIKWIMLVVGLITCSMLLTLFKPTWGLENMFGRSIDGPIATIVVRNWGALIALVGAMLVYAAFDRALHNFVLIVACISKLTFISLVLIFGQQFLSSAMLAIIFDVIAIVLFLTHLLTQQTNSNVEPN